MQINLRNRLLLKVSINPKYSSFLVYVVVNFLSQLIFIFPFLEGVVMNANDF